MHIQVFTNTKMMCNAYDDMAYFRIKTPEVLQSFPLKEISSRDLQSEVSSGKGNMSNNNIPNLTIKQLRSLYKAWSVTTEHN